MLRKRSNKNTETTEGTKVSIKIKEKEKGNIDQKICDEEQLLKPISLEENRSQHTTESVLLQEKFTDIIEGHEIPLIDVSLQQEKATVKVSENVKDSVVNFPEQDDTSLPDEENSPSHIKNIPDSKPALELSKAPTKRETDLLSRESKKQQQETFLSQASDNPTSPKVFNKIKLEYKSNKIGPMFTKKRQDSVHEMEAILNVSPKQETIPLKTATNTDLKFASTSNVSSPTQRNTNEGSIPTVPEDQDDLEDESSPEQESSQTEDQLSTLSIDQPTGDDENENNSNSETCFSKCMQCFWNSSDLVQNYVNSVFNSTPMVLIYFLLLITSGYVGFVAISYVDKCPMNSVIPLFLYFTAFGTGFIMLCCIWSNLKKYLKNHQNLWTPQPGFYLMAYHIISMLLLIVFIEYYNSVPSEDTSSGQYCNPRLCNYTFYVLYVMLGILISLPLLFFNTIVSILCDYATFEIQRN